ncbi:MAG: ABC transporter substrate-binding protein, partial [Chloroflexota bacterium]
MTIKIGLLTTLIGPYQKPGEDGVRGAKLALDEFNFTVGGDTVELVVEGTNAMASSATDAADRLLKKHDVDAIVGPLSVDEAVAIRDLARLNPDKTFVNGAAGSQPIYDPTANFFTFTPTGVQWIAGLGTFCYGRMGYRKVATVGEAYSFPYAQIGGFALEFCRAGGDISKMVWCALGTTDYTETIQQIPDDVDAVFSTLGGTDGLHFIAQYHAQRGDKPIIAGTICGDQSLLHFIDRAGAEELVGVLSASPITDDNPDAEWQDFVRRYRAA